MVIETSARWLGATLVVFALLTQLAAPAAQALHEHHDHAADHSAQHPAQHHDASHCQTCLTLDQLRTVDLPLFAVAIDRLDVVRLLPMRLESAIVVVALATTESPRAPPLR